jgi:hypothetical protein
MYCTSKEFRVLYDTSIEIFEKKNTFSRDKTKLNSMALVREQTKPTQRPPLAGKVSANFCG